MGEGIAGDWPLPEHPKLRAVAEEMERARRVGEVYDARWRLVHISRELCQATGVEDPTPYLGVSAVKRDLEHPEVWGFTPEALQAWWRSEVPLMRSTLEPGTPEFDEAFGAVAERAAAEEPQEIPLAWSLMMEFRYPDRLRYSGVQQLLSVRLNDDDGSFLGTLRLSWPALSGSVTGLLSRGDISMWERMAQKSEPARRPAAVLFVDLEASGEISRALPATVYFQLIRELTTMIDDAVTENMGIVGKHAGDGASAFFLAEDFDGSESAASAAAIRAARKVGERVRELQTGRELTLSVNAGVHWGSMLVIGQVVTSGRLEITALGDEVNETARIQDVARGGAVLASKYLIERIDPGEAAALGIDLDGLSYLPLARLEGASEKAVRDAGAIPIAAV